MLSPEILEVNSRTVPFWVIYDKDSNSYWIPKGIEGDGLFINMAIPYWNKEDAEKVLDGIKKKLVA